MSNQILLTAAGTPSEMRAAARDLITKADRLEVQLFREAGVRSWDIPNYDSDKAEGVLIEQHETGRAVQFRVMAKTDHNTVGSEWDSNASEPKKNRVYPPEFAFKSIAVVRLVSKFVGDDGSESSRYIEA